MKARTVIISGAVIWIIGTILFFSSPFIAVGTRDVGSFVLTANLGMALMPIGFFVFFGGIIYWLITRPKKIMIVDESGRAIKQQTIVQTKEREIETFDKMITKTIKCPACGETQEVQGVLGERVKVTCKKCDGEGVFHFH